MKEEKKDRLIAALLVVIALINISKYLTLNVLFPYAQTFGMKSYEFGYLAGSFAFLQLLSIPFSLSLANKFGLKNMLLICLIGSALSCLLVAMSQSLILIYLAKCIDGATGANIIITNTILSQNTSEHERLPVFSRVNISYFLAVLICPFIGGYLSTNGIRYPFYLSFLISCISVIVCIFFLKVEGPSKRADHENLKFKKFLTGSFDFRMMMLIVFATTSAQFGFNTLFQQHCYGKLSLTVKDVSKIAVTMSLVAVIVQLTVKKVYARIGNLKSILSLSLLFGCICIFIITIQSGLIPFVITSVAFVAFYAMRSPILTSMVSHLAAENHSHGFGFNQYAITIGQLTGSLTVAASSRYLPRYEFMSIFIFMILSYFLVQRLKLKL